MIKDVKIDDIKIDENTSSQAVRLLEEAMLFWHEEGQKLIKKLVFALEQDEIRLAASISKVWKGVDDRWIEIAAKLAPYQSAKRSSIQVNQKIEKRFVIVAPRVIADKKEWSEIVQREQELLPKPNVIQNIIKDDSIDELEYIDVNAS